MPTALISRIRFGRGKLVLGALVLLVAGATGGLALFLSEPRRAGQGEGAPAGFVVHEAPQELPAIRFETDGGTAMRLADFRGETVLLNIWATWCLPCREEMPALDRLQAELGGKGFEVVALSVDRGGSAPVLKFFEETGVRHLAPYIDRASKVTFAVKTVGLPTTLLIDPEGRELARLVGPAEWDTPEMTEFLRSHIAAGRQDGE